MLYIGLDLKTHERLETIIKNKISLVSEVFEYYLLYVLYLTYNRYFYEIYEKKKNKRASLVVLMGIKTTNNVLL